MPYVTFDDNFADHAKVAGLTDAAFRLHVAGILYCARQMSDGLIPAEEVKRLVRKPRQTSIDELLDRGLWVSILDGAYAIHDYLDWNDSRETILKRRAIATERKRRSRLRGES
jgi:hypothetical protein